MHTTDQMKTILMVILSSCHYTQLLCADFLSDLNAARTKEHSILSSCSRDCATVLASALILCSADLPSFWSVKNGVLKLSLYSAFQNSFMRVKQVLCIC